ncbi:DHA2 family efflux MFS transporter permease subunit [Paenibacillus pasadenensis]|uniref:DHA2 family efflux MFS transporter permease subunit n=1 Tax=Paenibacillus pasadenensis TaxID=217090 RepID=UPI00203B5066|nr:DHA2 family efflux MFS transporter permease subunit [Paenibacillus pasadenensis]MCM3748847.1 DHA2 family efflux MFS transporter permease subunit [Paenibacillus pasadenensis]
MKQNTRTWPVILAVLLGTFTVILNTSLLNPALPAFAEQFKTDELSVSWIINSYVLVMGLTLPLTGFFSRRFGSKKVYLAGLILFLIGSAAAAASGNLPVLITCRALQGFGAGLLTPLSITLIFAAVPVEQRGMATGIWGVVSMLAPTLGPTLGGLVIDHGDPVLLFLINLPTGLLGLIAGIVFLKPDSESNQTSPFDAKGYLFLAAGIGLSLYALGEMNTVERTSSLLHWGVLFAGLAFMLLFIVGRRKHSLLNFSLLKIREFRIGTVVTTLTAVGYYLSFFLIPIVIQNVYHLSATYTGLLFIPDAIMTGIFMLVGGKILDRNGARKVVAWGLFITGVTTLLLGCLTPDSPFWYITLLMALRGAGFGLSSIPATTSGMGALPEERLVEGSVLNDLIEQLASSIAIVICMLAFVTWRDGAVANRQLSLETANLNVSNGLFLALGVLIFVVLFAWLRSSGKPAEKQEIR